jgi:hypothetical protein
MTCACGCGRQVEQRAKGRPRRFATDACRAAAYRRRQALLAEGTPRQPNDHGRRRLAAAVDSEPRQAGGFAA